MKRNAKADLYEQLFKSSPLPLWIYDLQTLEFLDVNEVACRNYGYTRDEFLAMTIRDIRPPEDVGATEASVRNTPAQVFNSGIWRHCTKDGRLRYVEITSHEVEFQGRKARFVCPIDVTERVQAEAALREREAGLRRAQMVARLGHVITRSDGSFESWSETMPALAGLPPEEMPRSTRDWMNRLVHPEDRETFRARSIEAAVTRSKAEVEYRLLHRDGHIAYMSQVIEPIDPSKHERRLRWFSTLQDVTQQKEAALAASRLNDELERRVRERTAQLEASNRDLARASEAAEQANRAKSDFLARMSHELRTPLNAVLGFSELLAAPGHTFPAEQQAAFIENIAKAGRHLLALSGDLLNLAQVEAGQMKLEMERLPLADVLAECETLMGPQAAAKGVRLDLAAAPAAATVAADRTRLKQVLLNLMSNGVKYNRPGGQLQVTVLQPDAERVRIEVRDTGHGIAEEQLAGLFQPFNRLGRRAQDEEGTGLGLALTKHLVELMGGRIGVRSTQGVGSVFWIELAGSTAEAAPVDGTRPAKAPPTAPRTVLCVEDDQKSVELVKAFLAPRKDLRLVTACNGREGVALALAHEPAVILMDNHMPEMSGRQARQLLAEDPRTAHIPVVAVSAGAGVAAAQDDASDWFRCVAKPLDRRSLLQAIDDALRQKHQPR